MVLADSPGKFSIKTKGTVNGGRRTGAYVSVHGSYCSCKVFVSSGIVNLGLDPFGNFAIRLRPR